MTWKNKRWMQTVCSFAGGGVPQSIARLCFVMLACMGRCGCSSHIWCVCGSCCNLGYSWCAAVKAASKAAGQSRKGVWASGLLTEVEPAELSQHAPPRLRRCQHLKLGESAMLPKVMWLVAAFTWAENFRTAFLLAAQSCRCHPHCQQICTPLLLSEEWLSLP